MGGVPFWGRSHFEEGFILGGVPFGGGCPILGVGIPMRMGSPILGVSHLDGRPHFGGGGGSHFEGDPIIWGEVPFWGCLSWMGGLISGVGKGGESIRMGGSHFEEGPISGGGVPL